MKDKDLTVQVIDIKWTTKTIWYRGTGVHSRYHGEYRRESDSRTKDEQQLSKCALVSGGLCWVCVLSLRDVGRIYWYDVGRYTILVTENRCQNVEQRLEVMKLLTCAYIQ